MKKKILYEFKALYRGDFRITGYTFGEGEIASASWEIQEETNTSRSTAVLSSSTG